MTRPNELFDETTGDLALFTELVNEKYANAGLTAYQMVDLALKLQQNYLLRDISDRLETIHLDL
jgi:hypothetical protein